MRSAARARALPSLLRAAGDDPLGISVIWLCVPTGAYFLGKLCGLGAIGGWIGFIGETTLGSILYWLRWTRGAWRKDYAARP
ncbi:MAG: Multi antimicrobial extrusion protein [Labilithrix sp.]|nr:Multi antimicrobial extrusion protein [Labilithrix sp.]